MPSRQSAVHRRGTRNLFLGVDVGTGSARAGLFDARGELLGTASHAIRTWRPAPDFVEQSSEDIWKACCIAVRESLRQAGVSPDWVRGIGFDATCSLVVIDANGRPLSVSPTGRTEQDVIVWMDHRAVAEAATINASRHPVLRYVGGTISPEMQPPKLLWLKKHRPARWWQAARFFDLPDYLTWRATGDDTRSLCTTVCKWTYLGHKGLDGAGWDRTFFTKIGLGDLATDRFARIGQRVRPMGEALGEGLAPAAARQLGLNPGTRVGVAIIDAHAGGLGTLATPIDDTPPDAAALERRVALIGGTSSCHMAVSRKPRFIAGIWGPYRSAMVPDLWLTEGGQSATGALIDHVIHSHTAGAHAAIEAKARRQTIYELLNARLDALATGAAAAHPAELTRDVHVQPDFLGNRSPRADPTLRGAITGLKLSATLDDVAVLYLAAIQAVAYGTRHIIEEMNRRGYRIDTIFACGGGTKNPVFLREHADITGCTIVLPKEPEAVLLGSAVLGATAAGAYPTILDAMRAMNRAGTTISPANGKVARFHDAKYAVFHALHRDFLRYRAIMEKYLSSR